MAFLNSSLQQSLLDSFDWNDIPSLKPLSRPYIEQELGTIKQQGYAVTIDEATEGTTGIGAPIFSYENTVIGSLNVAGPSIRFGEESIEKYSNLVIKYANLVSNELGYRGNVRLSLNSKST